MSKFFIGFLVLFALIGTAYRLNEDKNKVVVPTLATYVDDELGFQFEYPETASITVGEPVIVPPDAKPLNVMASTTIMDDSGLNPEPNQFTREITQNTTVYYIKSGQFEAVISYDAYFYKNNFIIPLRYTWEEERWMDPEYDSTKDDRFKDFMNIIRSIEFIHVEQGIYEGIQENL